MKDYNSPVLCINKIKDEVVRCSSGGDDDEELAASVAEAAMWMHLAHITKPNDKNKK